MYFPASEWFASFALTVGVEAPFVILLLRRVEPDLVRLVPLVVFANLVTHPIVWFVFTQFVPTLGPRGYVVLAESWAVAAEAVFYWTVLRGLSARRAIGAAFVANAASYMVGVMVGGIRPAFP